MLRNACDPGAPRFLQRKHCWVTNGASAAGGGRVGMTANGTPLRLSCQPGRVPNVTDNDSLDDETSSDDAELDESALDDAQQAMYDARHRLAGIPAEVVVSNHVMGLYELAAIHLSAEPPRLHEAALAIDAVGCLVEGLGTRLGEDSETLTNALSNIRLAFVQIKSTAPPV